MELDITKFEDIKPTRGGRAVATFSLGKTGYFMANNPYIEENKELMKALSVNMKAMKEDDKIILLIQFLEDKSGTFSVNEFKDKNGKIKRKSFSARSVFKQLGLSYKNFAQEKTIKLTPEKKEMEGITYFIVEITLNADQYNFWQQLVNDINTYKG